MTEQEVIRLASQTTIEVLRKETEKRQKEVKEHLKENTVKLLDNYNKLKVHVNYAVADAEASAPSPLELMMAELFDKRGFIKVQAIVSSKERSLLMLAHVDCMLDIYRKQCESAGDKKYEVLKAFYLDKEEMLDIAKNMGVSESTGWRYLRQAVEEISVYLWGIAGIVA